jgi:hypothetical protein
VNRDRAHSLLVASVYLTGVGAVQATGAGLFGLWPWCAAGLAVLAAGGGLFAWAWPRWAEVACFIWQFRGGRVHHWHRPKAEIVRCTRTVGFHTS